MERLNGLSPLDLGSCDNEAFTINNDHGQNYWTNRRRPKPPAAVGREPPRKTCDGGLKETGHISDQQGSIGAEKYKEPNACRLAGAGLRMGRPCSGSTISMKNKDGS
jgi:hypothetical protein